MASGLRSAPAAITFTTSSWAPSRSASTRPPVMSRLHRNWSVTSTMITGRSSLLGSMVIGMSLLSCPC